MTRSTPSALFSPITFGEMTVPNRIAVAPMCQYSGDDGSPNDWHLQHWMNLAMSGAGMIVIESTAVERHGRITHGCLGLYSDNNAAAIQRCLAAARRAAPPATCFGIQLAHAGRKASVHPPWEGGHALTGEEDPWQTLAPSAIPFAPDWHVPTAIDENGIERVINNFASAAKRAVRAGFDFVEIHGAHGYLIHSFLSPLANNRTDQWGGSLENRMRVALAVMRAVRAAVPAAMPVGARLSATDWADGGFNPDEAVLVSRALKEVGAAFICTSSSGIVHDVLPPQTPGVHVPYATRIRAEAGIPTRVAGLIDDPHFAEAIIADGKADVVALARAMLADPRWPWRAAAALGHTPYVAPQYARAAPTMDNWVHAGA